MVFQEVKKVVLKPLRRTKKSMAKSITRRLVRRGQKPTDKDKHSVLPPLEGSQLTESWPEQLVLEVARLVGEVRVKRLLNDEQDFVRLVSLLTIISLVLSIGVLLTKGW